MDKLSQLAGAVVAHVNPRASDRQDCWQTAYLAGFQTVQNAGQKTTSSDMIFKAMRSAVYRLLCKRRPVNDADLPVSLLGV